MHSVANFGFHDNQLFSVPDKGSKVTIYPSLGSRAVCSPVEQHGGNAHQIQPVRAGLQVLALLLGIMGILLTVRSARESRVIDWSFFSRFVPKSFRSPADNDTVNPHEA